MSANGGELMDEARRMLEVGEIPDRVSNRLLWAAAVDAREHRRTLDKRLSALEVAFIRRAAFWGALGGIGAAVAALLVAM